MIEPVAWMSDEGLESLRRYGQASVVAGPGRSVMSKYVHPLFFPSGPSVLRLMPEVLAALRSTGDNVSLVADLEKVLDREQRWKDCNGLR